MFVKISENAEQAIAVTEGAVISVQHGGINVYGSYLLPQFYRERTDITWAELLNKAV